MKSISVFIARYPWVVLLVALIATVVFGLALKNLRIEAEVTRMLPEDEPGVRVLRVVDNEFGGSEQVVVLVEAVDLFAPEVLVRLDSMVQQLTGLAAVNEVVALTNLQDVRGVGDEVLISRLIDTIPEDSSGLEKLRQRLLGDRRYRGRLIAEDGKSTVLLVRLKNGVDRVAAVREIEQVVNENWQEGRVTLAGSAALMKYMRDWMKQDLIRLLPLVVGVLLLVFALAFRNWQGVVLPLLAVGLAVVWTMGLIGLTGQPLTVVLIVLPPVILTVGSAYGVHIVARWHQEQMAGKTGAELVAAVVEHTGIPVILAMTTTLAGFAANFVMRIVAIRAFAIFAVVGIFLSFLLTVFFLPAVLVLVARRSLHQDPGRKRCAFRPAGWWKKWAGWATKWALPVLGITAGLMALALFFGTKVKPETDFVRYFKPGSGPTRAAKVVNEQFGGELQFEIIVDGDIQHPAVLKQMERFINDLKGVPNITHITSIVDVLKATNRAFNQDRAEFEVIPDNRDAVAQFLLLLSFSGSDYLASMITSDYQRARITAQFREERSAEIGRAVKQVRDLIARDFSSDVKVELGGMPLAIYALHQGIARSQLISIIVAFVMVFLLVALMFRSVKLGGAAMVPIAWTLAVAFGVMGIMGIEVDIVTAMLGSIALGIGIDYSCHLIARFQEEGRKGFSGEERLHRTLSGVGPAILTNALAVGLGFAVLAFSSLVIIQKFGLLIAGAMLLATFGALILLPAIFARFRVKGTQDKI